MAQHFPTLSSFRARIASQTFSISSNEEDKWMLAKLLIKTGDIGHSMLAWDQHYLWACRVNEEFYNQVRAMAILQLAFQRPTHLCFKKRCAHCALPWRVRQPRA